MLRRPNQIYYRFAYSYFNIFYEKNTLLTSNNKHDWTPVKYLHPCISAYLHIWPLFCITIEHKTVATNFSFCIAKILQTSYFGYFGHVWPLPPKSILPTCRNFHIYHVKNDPFLTSFLRHCKDIANLLLWVIWEFLIIPINNDNINLVRNFDAQNVQINF